MSRIIARIKGGLGNQLFCYAAARRLAIVNEAELVIDDVTGFIRDHKYRRKYALDRFHITARRATKRERLEPFGRYRRALRRLVARRRPFLMRKYVEQDGIDFDPRLLDLRVHGTVYLEGLWQSEGYFKDVVDMIRADLAVIPPGDPCNREMAQRIVGCNAVAVHVRWFERPEASNPEHNLGSSYYARAVKEILDRVTEPYFFIFSEDPGAAWRMLDLPEDRATCVSHNRGDGNAYADLWLMTQCRHFVIANSTFSWWGAWLANSSGKVVICPEQESLAGMQGWGFSGLIPDTWICL